MDLLRMTLGNRDLTRIEVAWAATSLGNWAFSILLALYAYRQGGTEAVALALLARMLPAGLAAPYTAMLVDRHSRRSVLVWTSVIRTLALGGAAAAAAAATPLGVVLLFAAVFTIANTAHRPAQAALMPLLARTPAELAAANVCWTAIEYAGFLSGSVVAGVLVGLIDLDLAFAACAATFAVTTVLVSGLPADRRPPPVEEATGAFAELAEGLRTVWEHREIRLLVGLFTVDAVIQGVFDVLVVIAAIELLGLGESGAGWLNAAWGVGGVLGGVAAFALLGRGRLAAGLSVGMAVSGLTFAVVGAWPEAGVAIPMLILMGVGFAVVETALLTLTQRLAPDDVLGRVFGVEEGIEVGGQALGSVLAAALVGLLGVDGAMIAAGLVLPAAALLTARRVASSEAGAQVPERTFGLVRALPLFAALPIAVLENIALRLSERTYGDGQPIVTQGEVGDSFFVIADGEVAVQVDGAPRRPLHAGDFFGEIALLRDVPRTASVSAVGEVSVLVIERDDFLLGVAGHPRSVDAAERVVAARLDRDRAA
jgi:Major Facilitator Superfamily/Cyclic nucleotide-binding domain